MNEMELQRLFLREPLVPSGPVPVVSGLATTRIASPRWVSLSPPALCRWYRVWQLHALLREAPFPFPLRPCAGGIGFGNYTNPVEAPYNVEPQYQLNGGWLTLFWRQGAIPNGHWLDAAQQATKLLRPVNGELQNRVQQHVFKVLQRNDCLRSVGVATREVLEAFVASL